MTALVPGSRLALPSIAAWLENPWSFAEHHPVRIEESTEDGKYVGLLTTLMRTEKR